jgi:hypothetical protein
MSISEYARAANAAREFDVSSPRITLRLRLPTRLQMQRIVARTEEKDVVSAQEQLLCASIIGWSGVAAEKVVPNAEGQLAFDPDLIAHVLDAFPDEADAAFLAIVQRYAERRAAAETAAKN